MRLGELLRTAGLTAPHGNTDPEISGVTRDSRTVKGGELFAAIPGRTDSGEKYIADAAARGAAAILAGRDYCGESFGLPIVRAASVRAGFARLCAAAFGQPQLRMRIFGITGTNGKTSTAYFLERMLAADGRHTAMIGSNGLFHDGHRVPFPPQNTGISQMTTPDPELLYPMLAELASEGVTDVVMEVSSHALALEKVAPICFRSAIFTNFASDHLDFHGTREEYKRAKLYLASQSDTVIYNGDDPEWREAFRWYPRAFSFGTSQCDFSALRKRVQAVYGVSYLLVSPRAAFRMSSRIAGDFTVMNSLGAAAAALLAGVSPETVADAAESLERSPGRVERMVPESLPGVSVIIDYAHTEMAMQRLLSSLASCRKSGRLITVFGCGGDRDKGKRAPMGRAAAEGSDLVIVTSDNPRSESPVSIVKDILRGMKDFNHKTVVMNRGEAITAAICLARQGDTVLLVGKGREDYEIDADGRHYYSEREAVESAAEKRMELLKKRSIK